MLLISLFVIKSVSSVSLTGFDFNSDIVWFKVLCCKVVMLSNSLLGVFDNVVKYSSILLWFNNGLKLGSRK